MLKALQVNQEVEKLITTSVKVMRIGKVNNSQDGVVCDSQGIAPTHTAGHGNCLKIIENE